MNSDSKRRILYILVLIALLIASKYFRGINFSGNEDAANVQTEMLSKQLIYTKHAKCRMNCRYIDQNEIQDVLRNGRINPHKSDPNDTPCPTYAIENNTQDGQTVRIVFANCDDVVKVVTAIDIRNHYNCKCD